MRIPVARLVACAALSCVACAPPVPSVSLWDAGGDAPFVELRWDAGPPCECAPRDACDDARCEEGTCVHTPRADGEHCGEAQLCVAARCVARGCGDGWRERGPEPSREACDVGADALSCDARCEPAAWTAADDVASPPGKGELAIAAGDDGALLVWIERGGSGDRLRARLLSTRGETHRSLELASGALVAGLAAHGVDGGYAVAWIDASDGAHVVRIAAEDGALTELVPRAPVGARAPALASSGTDLLFAWADDRSVHARRWRRGRDAADVVLDTEPTLAETDDEPTLAASGEAVLIAWSRRSADGLGTRVMARRLDRGALGEARALARELAWGPAAHAAGARLCAAWSHRDALGVVRPRYACVAPEGVEESRELAADADGVALTRPAWLALGEAPHALVVRGLSRPSVRVASDAHDIGVVRLREALAADAPSTAAVGVRGDVAWIAWPTHGALRALRMSVDALGTDRAPEE